MILTSSVALNDIFENNVSVANFYEQRLGAGGGYDLGLELWIIDTTAIRS